MASKVGTSPRLTVKALAEMLRLPAYEQSRILNDQKYPKQEPQSFRTPYYQQALAGIRDYYRSANNAKILEVAKNDLQNIGNEARRANNLRVLTKYIESSQPKRKLLVLANSRYAASIGAVEVRLSPDLQVLENKVRHIIYYNCRVTPVPDEIATLTIEIAHWVLSQNGVDVEYEHVEVVDLATGKAHRRKKGRAATIKAIKNNGKIIETLWSAL